MRQKQINTKFAIMLCFTLLAIMFTMALISALPFCLQDNYQNKIPCVLYTPIINCSSVAYIYQMSNNVSFGSMALSSANPSCSGSCVYNMTFNVSTLGNYFVQLCDGSHSSISVSPAIPNTAYPLLFKVDFSKAIYIVILILIFLAVILLCYLRQFIFAGFLSLITGFILLFSGINFLISFLVITIGALLIFLTKRNN